jgi:hypothetical protein
MFNYSNFDSALISIDSRDMTWVSSIFIMMAYTTHNIQLFIFMKNFHLIHHSSTDRLALKHVEPSSTHSSLWS